MKIPFEKYEGLGNDFVIVERSDDNVPLAFVRELCDRHRGVGADGLLIVTPPRTPGAAGTMVVRNADGSRPEMCGNGLRCVARFLARTRDLGSSFVVDTDAGPRLCERRGDGVSIGMGLATIAPENASIDVDGEALVFRYVSMGNPHAVVWSDPDDETFARQGLALTTHEVFPQGSNAEFARLLDDGSLAVRVWERGVGPTLACGTGACAVAVVACSEGRAAFDAPVVVRLPGGPLVISVERSSLAVRMEGPARFVFAGWLEC